MRVCKLALLRTHGMNLEYARIETFVLCEGSMNKWTNTTGK